MTGRLGVAVVTGLGVLACAGFGAFALVGAFLGAGTDHGAGACTRDLAPVLATGVRSVGDLTSAQLANAGIVIAEGRRLGVPSRGILVALAAASQESHFTNYANDGQGGDVTSVQLGVSGSLRFPHEAVRSDHGSVGIFQQQWPWWGTLRDLMDPARAADKFYAALLQVRGWSSLPLTVAAQRVQRSAYPNAYADDEPLARRLLGGARGSGMQAAAWSGACTAPVVTGAVVFPLPTSASYVDQHNFGSRGGHWASFHTGTDLSTPCGTPVLAATAGTVVIRTDQPWAGRWLVQVSTGIGQLTTWYAHMRALTVSDGQRVSAGEQIGEVGDLGNATGCHLHFEVHPTGGSIYQDAVDPSSWLASHVGQWVTAVPVAASSERDWFTVATFNVLGASHTAGGGKKRRMASGVARTRGVMQLLEKYGVDVVGLQELQTSQYRALRARTGGAFAFWSTRTDTENAIAWRRDRFRLVDAHTLSLPYFDGHRRRMPVLRLLDLRTRRTVVFLNVHNPADTRRYPHQAGWRRVDVSEEISLVRRLSGHGGTPVVVTGDMNDRHDVYCRLTTGGLMQSATGPATGGRCHPPAHPQIDWIFGSRRVQLRDYTRERSALVRWTSDHPFVVARAHAG